MITSILIASMLGTPPAQPPVQSPLTIEWHLTSTHPAVSEGAGFAVAGWAMPVSPAMALSGGGFTLSGSLQAASATTPCDADLNQDGVIDTLDLLEAFDRFALTSPGSFDLDGDGSSTVLDLLEYLDRFTSVCD